MPEKESGNKSPGWERVKELFEIRPGEDVAPELKDLSLTIFISSVVGFLFGGMIGARHAGDKYIALNHASKYTSTMQAQRELHTAAVLGFVRKGSHWGWRVGLFAGLFSGSTRLLSEYRGKQDTLNYISAGATTGGLFRLSRGLKPLIGGTVLGGLISVPVGLCMNGLDLLLVGSEEREKLKQSKMEARCAKQEKWKKRLSATSALIQDIDQPESSTGLQSYYRLGTDTATSSSVESEASREPPDQKT